MTGPGDPSEEFTWFVVICLMLTSWLATAVVIVGVFTIAKWIVTWF